MQDWPVPFGRMIDRINSILQKSGNAGERRLANGTRLVEPAPDIGQKAWRHLAFASLADEELSKLEHELRQRLPPQLKMFFRKHNGISLFGNEINIWGKRSNFVRSGDDIWQPFDIVRHNNPSERPRSCPYSIVFFGSTNQGEKWVFFSPDDGSIGKTSRTRYQPEQSWPDFNSWLLDELAVYDHG